MVTPLSTGGACVWSTGGNERGGENVMVLEESAVGSVFCKGLLQSWAT